MSNTAVYEQVTDKILALLAEGTVPWHKPWKGGAAMSMSTNKPYRGINVFLLDEGYHGTYKKITELGGQVRKGEKSSLAVFWKFVEKKDDKTGKVDKIPFLRYFRVFHSSQADWPDGLPERFALSGDANEADRITEAEQVVAGYVKGENGPRLSHGGGRACYNPATDSVTMPELTAFTDADHYYSTMFHELGHSTGHASRLDREGVTNFDAFGSHQYAAEELVAEMTAAMVSAALGIDSTVETSAAYLAHWSATLGSDPKLIVRAAGQAQKAADLIRGITWEKPADD
jgi:antirestriction protein ArdC